jgi:hypothetical protein
MSYFAGGGHSKVSKTKRGFFYDVIEIAERDAEVYVNGRLVNDPKGSFSREYRYHWDKIIGAAFVVILGVFICAKLVGL